MEGEPEQLRVEGAGGCLEHFGTCVRERFALAGVRRAAGGGTTHGLALLGRVPFNQGLWGKRSPQTLS